VAGRAVGVPVEKDAGEVEKPWPSQIDLEGRNVDECVSRFLRCGRRIPRGVEVLGEWVDVRRQAMVETQ
jgi:hypothetical protein